MNSKSFTINSAYKNVSSVCFITKTFCEDNNINAATIKHIELCLAEALNNIIKHSYKGNEENKIDVSLNFINNSFSIILTDYGESRTNVNKPKLDFDPNDINNLPEGGMGLFIIDQLMDENNYSTFENKNLFKLVKYID